MGGVGRKSKSPERRQAISGRWRILRRCDAYDLLWVALDRFERDYPDEYGSQDIENARDELRILRESAETNRLLYGRRHGIK